jgi:hypothetical protein
MSNPDALAMVPVCSTSVRDGSFLGGNEDQFMACVWRVRSWTMSSGTEIKCNFTPPDPGFVVLAAGLTFISYAGSVSFSEISPYNDHTEILCDFRETYTYLATTSMGIPQSIAMRYGTACEYSENRTIDGVPFAGSGVMDSLLSFMAYDGDEFAELTTLPGPGYIATNIVLNVVIQGVIARSVTLYAQDISESFADFSWTGGTLTLEPQEWWEWPLDGEPTWDRYTGEKLLPVDRVGQDGRTLAFLAQP